MHVLAVAILLSLFPTAGYAQSEGWSQLVSTVMLLIAGIGVLAAVGVAALIGALLSGSSTPPKQTSNLHPPPPNSAPTPPPTRTITASTNPAVPVAVVLATLVALGYFLSNFSPSPLLQLVFMGASGGFIYSFPFLLIIAIVIAGLASTKQRQTYLSEQAESAGLESSPSSEEANCLPSDVSVEDAQLMEALSISFDGNKFIYSGSRYDHLKDAIAYAKQESGHAKTNISA